MRIVRMIGIQRTSQQARGRKRLRMSDGSIFDPMQGKCIFHSFAFFGSRTFTTPNLIWDVAFGINATVVTFGILGARDSIIMPTWGSIYFLVVA